MPAVVADLGPLPAGAHYAYSVLVLLLQLLLQQIWDLRKRKCIYTIPAHNSLVSTVQWQHI
jgi:hypothetical protein